METIAAAAHDSDCPQVLGVGIEKVCLAFLARIDYSLRMKTIENYVKKYQMITRGDRVIAGVSGGADSVCLFLALLELRKKFGFELFAVHVNHGLRGAAADKDERFVCELCRKHQVACKVFRVNLESIAKKRKQSMEEAGRTVRREMFAKAIEQFGGSKIALAHHQNDNAETLLWNLCRGSGLTGLGGIRPVNGCYIRPLLCMNRQEIEEFLAQRGQPYCTDATNAETDYTRNRLRHHIIPVLEQEINTQSVRHMNETMRQMREIEEYMEQQTTAAAETCVTWGESRRSAQEIEEMQGAGQSPPEYCLIHWQTDRAYPPLIKKLVIRRCIERLCGGLADIGQIHIETVADLFGKQVGRSLNLPAGLTAQRVYEGVRLSKTACTEEKNQPTQTARNLRIPGETYIAERGLAISCKIIEKPQHFLIEEIPEKVYTKWMDYAIMDDNDLKIRTRQPGDYLVIDQEGHIKKLKDWFVDSKIPADRRDEILLIAQDSRVLWIVGYRMGSDCLVKEHTEKILQIELKRNNGGKDDVRDNSCVSIRRKGR